MQTMGYIISTIGRFMQFIGIVSQSYTDVKQTNRKSWISNFVVKSIFPSVRKKKNLLDGDKITTQSDNTVERRLGMS